MLVQMGMDTVEIVMRVEETFNVDLPDEDCGRIVTVGDLYRLALSKLELPYVQAVESAKLGRDRSHGKMPSLASWSSPDVWLTIRGIIVDQLQVDEEDVKEEAEFQRDLGCD